MLKNIFKVKNPMNPMKRLNFNPAAVTKARVGLRPMVETEAKKKGYVIYGARSLQKQIGPFARPTGDWDMMARHPKSAARTITKKLNSIDRNYYYKQSDVTPGVYKVYDNGNDRIPRTQDDVGIIDFSKRKPDVKTKTINGIKYSALAQEKANYKKSLKDKAYAFRHDKDRYSLNSIENYESV